MVEETKPGCTEEQAGHCSMHYVEVERRKSGQKDISDLKEAVAKIEAYISDLLTYKNRLIGWSTLMAAVLFGGYYYTGTHVAAAEEKYKYFEAEICVLRDSIAAQKDLYFTLKEMQARSDERSIGIGSRLNSIDGRLVQMIGLLVKDGRITSEQLLEIQHEK